MIKLLMVAAVVLPRCFKANRSAIRRHLCLLYCSFCLAILAGCAALDADAHGLADRHNSTCGAGLAASPWIFAETTPMNGGCHVSPGGGRGCVWANSIAVYQEHEKDNRRHLPAT